MKHLLQLPWGGLQYITASTPSTARSPLTCVKDREYLLVNWFSITLSSNEGKQEEINPQDSSAAVTAYIALCFDLASRTFFWIIWNKTCTHSFHHLPIVLLSNDINKTISWKQNCDRNRCLYFRNINRLLTYGWRITSTNVLFEITSIINYWFEKNWVKREGESLLRSLFLSHKFHINFILLCHWKKLVELNRLSWKFYRFWVKLFWFNLIRYLENWLDHTSKNSLKVVFFRLIPPKFKTN